MSTQHMEDHTNVTPLRDASELSIEPAPPPSRPGHLHGLATSAMAVCALAGIAALYAFVTMGWEGESRRWLIAGLTVAGLGFLISAGVAVLAAARDTHARRAESKDE
jgi:hypothetical protein